MNKSVIKASKVGGGGSSASIMQKVCDLGGLFVLLYIIFLGLTTLITMGKMENYLVSELYSEPATTDGNFKQDQYGNDGMKRRDTISSKFYNAIQNNEAEVLDHAKVSGCCLGGSRLGQIFMRGREITREELNVTRLVGAARTGSVMKKQLAQMVKDKAERQALKQSTMRAVSMKKIKDESIPSEVPTDR